MSAGQPHLYAVGMGGGISQDVLDDALGQLAGGLVGLEHDGHLQAGLDNGAGVAVHGINTSMELAILIFPGFDNC